MKGKMFKRLVATLMATTMVLGMSIVSSAARKTATDAELKQGVQLASGNEVKASDGVLTLAPTAGELSEDDYLDLISLAVNSGGEYKNLGVQVYEDQINTISANVFAELKKNNLGLTVVVGNGAGVSYGWIFDKITNAVAFNPALTVNPENSENIASLVNGKSYIVDFDQNGKLPGLAQVGIWYNDDEVEGIDSPALYYYNAEKKSLEVQDNNIEIADGVVVFELAHCSTYVVANKNAVVSANDKNNVKASNPQTGDSAPIALFAVAMVIALGAAAVVVIRKRRVA